MARKNDTTPDVPEVDVEMVTTAPDDWEFETVAGAAATLVEFESFGDTFVGQYVGEEHIDPDNGRDDPFDRYNFTARDGNLYAVNKSYKLQQAMDAGKVNVGDWVKLTYVNDIPTKRGLNPMKDITVQVRRK